MAVPSYKDAATAHPKQFDARVVAMSETGSVTSRSYEIQRFSSGRWMLDSVSDDKDVAIAMAKSLMASGRAPAGVRVMSVQQNPTGQFSQITIFRRAPGESAVSDAPAPKPKIEADAKPAEDKRDFKHGTQAPATSPKKSRFADLIFALKLAIGIGITLAAFQALRLTVH